MVRSLSELLPAVTFFVCGRLALDVVGKETARGRVEHLETGVSTSTARGASTACAFALGRLASPSTGGGRAGTSSTVRRDELVVGRRTEPTRSRSAEARYGAVGAVRQGSLRGSVAAVRSGGVVGCVRDAILDVLRHRPQRARYSREVEAG